MPENKKYRILSIDGGGIRGIIPARLLFRLMNEDPAVAAKLAEVDLIVGTSTGAIVGLGLAANIPLQQICNLYINDGRKIFDGWRQPFQKIRELAHSAYDNAPLEAALRGVFGTKTLGDLYKKVAVTAFDLDGKLSLSSITNGSAANNPMSTLDTWKPKVLHNLGAPKDNDGYIQIVKAALYSSAAPTYFPAVDGYIDGGVFANNPSMIALAQALDKRNVVAGNSLTACPNLEDIVLLSIGTGFSPDRIKNPSIAAGDFSWVQKIINIMFDGTMGTAHFQCKQLLGEQRYWRHQLIFDEAIRLDDVDKVCRMDKNVMSENLEPLKAWIKTHW